ncbi:DNA-3-methyladenine glycosylase family protein [Paenibacillus sp. TAB 01]|uniref:DNA-3-methyladenine glycosylase family protein n=1 Tax=Paenibacillus sp. TAB 01 TaxID=3368988 RepID=UPI00375298BE
MGALTTKWFDYGEDAVRHLQQADPALGAAMTRMGRVERTVIPDLFAALVHAIVGQLISAKAADTVWRRLQERCKDISPERVAGLSADEIQQCGLTMKKAVCIHTIARMIAGDEFRLDELYALPDREVIRRLTMLDGVGAWTAEMLLLNSMERSDIVSWGDMAIRRGMMKLYGLEKLTREQFEQYRLRYSPYGSVASIYLWQISFE